MISWAYKEYKEFTPHDRTGLTAHLKTMNKDKALDYVKYLHTHCGAPHHSNWSLVQ